MALELAQLRTLYWVARRGSFRAAAASLNVSQPAVSLRIRKLEQETGLLLFKRKGRSVTLTEDGATVLDYAERILGLAEDLSQRPGADRELRGIVRLGVPDSFALLCLADMLQELDSNCPNLNVAVTVEATPILSRRLDEGALDVCVLVEPLPTRNLRLWPLGVLEQVWAAKSGLFEDSRHCKIAELSRQRILTIPPPSYTHDLLMGWFIAKNLTPSRLSTCNSIAAVLELVRRGSGISLLPLPVVAEEIASGVLTSLSTDTPLAKGTVYVGCAKATTNRAIIAVTEMIRSVVRRRPLLA